MIESLITLFSRDLDKLKIEIESFRDDANIWKITGEVKNTSGNLAMHIAGNLEHFIGTTLGNTSYVRDREFEFAGKDVPKAELAKKVDSAKEAVANTLRKLSEADLSSTYTIKVFNDSDTTEQFILHLYGHLNWHLGQINYSSILLK